MDTREGRTVILCSTDHCLDCRGGEAFSSVSIDIFI